MGNYENEFSGQTDTESVGTYKLELKRDTSSSTKGSNIVAKECNVPEDKNDDDILIMEDLSKSLQRKLEEANRTIRNLQLEVEHSNRLIETISNEKISPGVNLDDDEAEGNKMV